MTDALTRSIRRSVWWGWGDPADGHPLPAQAWEFLRRELGGPVQVRPEPPVALAEVVLRPPVLADDVRAALVAAVGAEHVRQDSEARVEHVSGKSWPDLYRLRHGDGGHAPDAVVLPADAAEVAAVLAACAAHRVAVVPFGGGTSVVGGVAALRGPFASVVSLDLRRLDRMTAVDPVSRVATLQAGMRGPDVERALRAHGLTLGHYPQSHQEATLGGYLATRSAGQASTGYGRPDERVVGVRVATPEGELVLGGRAPASAAGPRLIDLVVGSEGALGVITEATLVVSRYPAEKAYGCWAFPSLEAAATALRRMAQDLGHGVVPDVCRVSDPDETRVSLTLAGRAGGALVRYAGLRGMAAPCLALFVWEGDTAARVRHRRRECEAVLGDCGGRRLPSAVARTWEKGRFSGPYLRDELMGHRVLAETLETATTWSNLLPAYDAVRTALVEAFAALGTPALVQCHLSHVYPAGASLYFTVVAREADDPLAQWTAMKAAAGRAIVAAGATITHHHAVGVDHLPFLGDEIGPLGVRLLQAAKDALDPVGVLNPGKLVPPPPSDV